MTQESEHHFINTYTRHFKKAILTLFTRHFKKASGCGVNGSPELWDKPLLRRLGINKTGRRNQNSTNHTWQLHVIVNIKYIQLIMIIIIIITLTMIITILTSMPLLSCLGCFRSLHQGQTTTDNDSKAKHNVLVQTGNVVNFICLFTNDILSTITVIYETNTYINNNDNVHTSHNNSNHFSASLSLSVSLLHLRTHREFPGP